MGPPALQLRYEIKFSEPRISKPAVREADASGAELQALTPLYPAEARLRNLTYESWLYIDVEKRAFNATTQEPEGEAVKTREWFGMIPIMVQ